MSRALKPPTERQAEILAWIGQFAALTGRGPLAADVAHHFEIAPQVARQHLRLLSRKQCIELGHRGRVERILR